MSSKSVAALLIGREGSTGFPGKNLTPLLGRPMMIYPILASRHARTVDRIYVSTDSPRIRDEAAKEGAEWIERPPELATPQALGEEAFAHGYREIRRRAGEVEFLVLLMCNAPTILAATIDEGIGLLRNDPAADSAVTVSRYNMWGPPRARRIGADGGLHPYVPLDVMGEGITCDRDSGGDVYFADMAASIVRPRCLENLHDGLPPQKWMGKRILPLRQEGGLDVDYPWQLPQVEHWLRAKGFGEDKTPYDSLLPAPRG